MVTLPVFHYFILYKNPCVLPANRNENRSGNIDKKELFFYVLFLTFFMQDLFANGFGPQ
jgi:hypothetical protein